MIERTIQQLLQTTGLTEAELVDLLEGGALPSDREAALRATLARSPDVARLFAGVRADRTALRVLDHSVLAPAGLLEAVEIRLDQDALRSLTEPAVSAPIPVASTLTRIERRSPLLVLLENVWARRLASAAAILLAIGLGVWGTYIGIQNWPRNASSAGAGADALALNNASGTPETQPTDGAASEAIIAAAPAASPAFTMLAETSPVAGPGIMADGTVLTESQLLDLAGAGRLAIVITGNSRVAADRLSRLAAAAPGVTFSSGRNGPSTALSFPVSTALAREASLPRAEWAAALRDPWSVPSPAASVGSASSPQVMSVACGADPASLRSVLTACGLFADGASPRGRTVRVLVLDHSATPAPSLDAPSVLWWSASPARWSRTTTVPIIIEE